MDTDVETITANEFNGPDIGLHCDPVTNLLAPLHSAPAALLFGRLGFVHYQYGIS